MLKTTSLPLKTKFPKHIADEMAKKYILQKNFINFDKCQFKSNQSTNWKTETK